ncbi:hypothetical protein DFH27DRAFT_583539 [Peziza echinospora]|nr:hypothetical protein DFH27DRAFT_583539 [Peziza echinospora]
MLDDVQAMRLSTNTTALMNMLGRNYNAPLNDSVHNLTVGSLLDALTWITSTPLPSVIQDLGWTKAGKAEIDAFVSAAQRLIPTWVPQELHYRDIQIFGSLWKLRQQTYPAIRMWQKGNKWWKDRQHKKLEKHYRMVGRMGWVTSRKDVEKAVDRGKVETENKFNQ